MTEAVVWKTLNNGHKIPVIGFGTFAAAFEKTESSVSCAIDAGYRHIDCAHFYRNQTAVGSAIKKKITENKIKRDDLFITSKLWCDAHDPSEVKQQCAQCLKDLGVSCLDLYLMHWPTSFKVKPNREFTLNDSDNLEYLNIPLEDTWKAMEALVDAGLVKSIGVSNFNKTQIDRILQCCRIKPVMNQIEVSVNWMNEKIISHCTSQGIEITAYAPLGSPGVMKDAPPLMEEEFVKEIAKAHGKQPSQILARHAIQRGIIVLMKSVSPDRIISNFQVFDFELTKEEMNILNTSGRQTRLFAIPSIEGHPEYPFHDEY